MCGIAGFSNLSKNFKNENGKWTSVLNDMKVVQNHRGPDDSGIMLEEHVGFSQVKLSIMDLKNGHQPISRKIGDRNYTIICDGELYNAEELKYGLITKDWRFRTNTDTEIILLGFIEYGDKIISKINGIFSFAIWDEKNQTLFLVRDRLGTKPLFYTICNETLVFGSELKALFQYPGIQPTIDKNGLGEIFGMGPAKTYGSGVFKDCHEVLPGHYIRFNKDGIKDFSY